MTYKYECPQCGNNIEYKNKRTWYNSKRNKSTCMSCAKINISKTLKDKHSSGEVSIVPRRKKSEITYTLFRNCPSCDSVIGYTTKQKLVVAEKNNSICNSCSTKKYKKGVSFNPTESSIKQMRATKAGFKDFEEYKEKYPEKEMYKREVWKYTYRNDVTVLPNNDKRGRCGTDGAYQLDHIISINEGWEKNIPAEEIGRMDNLQIITWEENRKKW